jgi:CheY-like chemotaxis protein/signal transduction histidine kinase
MTWFRGGRLSPRTTIAMVLAGGTTLLLVGGAFVVNDFLQLRRIVQHELSIAGNVVSSGSATALSLRDRESASRTLRLLGDDESIATASLYLRDGVKPLASYSRHGADTVPLPANRQPGIYKEGKSILLVQSVVLNGQVVGTLAIHAGIDALTSLLPRELGVAALMLTCILMGFLCTLPLPWSIVQPAMAMAETVLGNPLDGVRMHFSKASISMVDPAVPSSHVMDQETIAGNKLPANEAAARIAALEGSNSELIAANNRAVEAGRLKDEFLANISHKVRTPINGVIAMAELALETDLTPEQRQYVASAGTSAESLRRVIDDILDFFRIEAGGLTLAREEFGISEILYDVMKSFSPAARQKGLALLLNVHGDVPLTVLGDPATFRRIMVNLIDNALKFTEAGRVTVEVAPVFHSERVVGLHFQVRDTGSGLATGQFGRAIEPFGEVHDSDANSSGGNTGLGLAIANRLIGMIGGCLWLDSDIGSGSIFHFTATFDTPNASAPVALNLTDLRGASVLVADGSPVTRRILQQLLSRWQMRITLAASGEEAIDLMRRAKAAGSPFDIALVDRHMLGVDGGALTREVGEHPEVGSPMIMVLSSINTVSVTDLTRDFGSTSYLVKPISHSTLLKAVSGAMHTVRGERKSVTSIISRIPGKPARILVAEDNVTSQAVAVSILAKEGYEVTIARNGTEAVNAYDRGGLDMILMDLQMPGMSGLEATHAIRLREAGSGKHITILALTAHATVADRERCLEAGMDDYVTKPLHVRSLRQTVGQWLSHRSPPRENPQAVPDSAA